MAKKQFKAESKRLLDLMINSIYTNREIFIRELISNASDAIDKLYYKSLTDSSVDMKRSDFKIEIEIDRDKRTLTVKDNGIGMTKEELDNNLGVIAKSGSREFNAAVDSKDIDIIGQFGVGFYSAFMVADRITVDSRAFGADQANRWESNGADGYTVEPCERDGVGTTITLYLKPDTDDDKYSDYLDCYRISGLVKKYSDYIRYPIVMDMERGRIKEGTEDEYESYTESTTLNSMVPIWKKNKKEVEDKDYNEFYKSRFFDYDEPLDVISQRTEGTATYSALMFIPSRAPYNFYSKDYEKGLALYTGGVMIMERCADLLPDCFSFIKGLVDSEDLSLNISREMLQQDRQLKVIAGALEKRIKKELADMLANDREKYEKFWSAFGLQIKYGVYSEFGANKDLLLDLLMFRSAAGDKMITLKEYRDAMPEDQKYIYYAAGEAGRVSTPSSEAVRAKGYDILMMTDDVDEFVARTLNEYDGKQFRSISGDDLGLRTDDEKKKDEELRKDHEELFGFIKDSLEGKVTDVTLSDRLTDFPVCVTTKGTISLEMERLLNAMPGSEKVTAERVLELNAEHPVFEKLKKLYDDDKDKLKEYAEILYDEAMLVEGIQPENPTRFAKLVFELM